MTTEQLRRVEEIVEQALDLPSGDWPALLDSACQADESVRSEVESLLSHHDSLGGDFLTPSAGRPIIHSVQADRQIGRTIGRYHIKAVLGSGGMGTVYLAKDEHLSREVAVKTLNLAWRNHPTRQRFEWESRVLAQLHHPHIAQVYEAGTFDDERESVPYFVMEYIPQAVSIIEYARRERLGLRKKLELFLQICDAVQHGHQNSIVHRDLKPGNLLVDQNGHIKVIDFGIARATDSDIALTTMVTDTGQIVGTLQYMSPEQIDGAPEALDIRSDIYSLGVVLYELVCGQLPYDVKGARLTEAARRIHQDEVPAPRRIDRALKGDLETIIQTAMERDRPRRYQSASELAADIRRYLNREPIMARPPTQLIRVARLMGRHPVAASVAVGVLIAITIVASAYSTVWYARKAPYDVILNEKQNEARVVNLIGETIGEPWTAPMKGGIGFAKKVLKPAELGGGMMAVIGFGSYSNIRHTGELRAYELSRHGSTLAWRDFVEGQNLPDDVTGRNHTGKNFGAQYCWIFDVFPEQPGEEIIVVYSHTRSRRLVRILDLNGDRLFQFWHDGAINDCRWLADANRLLISAMIPDPVETRDRKEQRYSILFAVEPKIGVISHQYITQEGSATGIEVAWYRYLAPKMLADEIHLGMLMDVPGDYPAGLYCWYVASLHVANCGAGWVLSADGELLPETTERTDGLLANPDLNALDWSSAYLSPTPPWVNLSNSSNP